MATQLRRQFPEVNFVVPESAGNAYVRLILRSVTLGDILKAIELASDGKIRASVAGTGQTVDSATGLPMTTVGSDARSNLVSFAFAGYAPDPPLPPENHVACRVFSLSPYLAGLSEKETDAAIKSLHEAFAISLGMLTKFDRDITSPDFQIHQGTKLLIAVGREKELVVIEQIIKELPGSAPSATLPSPVKNDPKAKTASPGPSPTGAK